MRQYLALIHKDNDSDFGVSFPDFPGCVTAGRTLDEARLLAEQALTLHVKGLVEDAKPMPEPSTIEAVMADRQNHDGVVILVPLKSGGSRAIRVDVTIPEDVLERIDRYAESRGLNRSGFLTQAAMRAMEKA